MSTPYDDDFSGPLLDSKWTFYPSSPGADGSYSFIISPGNITFSVPSDANITPGDTLNGAVSLRQSQGSAQYHIDAGITGSGVSAVGDESGIFIAKAGDPTKWVMLTKKFTALTTQIHAAYMSGGVVVSEAFVAYNNDINIILRITRFGGNFSFSYKAYADANFTAVPLTVADTLGTTEIGLVAFAGGAPAYSYTVDYFHARSLSNIAMNGDVLLRVTNLKKTKGDTLLVIRNYPSVRAMKVLQHFESPINTIEWFPAAYSSPTILSPGGIPYTISVADDGAVTTFPGTGAPVPPIVILDSIDNFWLLGVQDDGAVSITPAPAGTTLADVCIVTAISPNLTNFEIIITYTNNLNPVDPAITTEVAPFCFSENIIVRKEDSFPTTPTDGTVVYTGSAAISFDDGPIQSRARQFYSIFSVYSDKTSPPTMMATMPVFVNLYQNIGHRFSRAYQRGPWWMLYSISKVIQFLVDIDIPAALGQFNIKTASGAFLDLWGKIFGTRRYPAEGDAVLADRIISRVLLGRTVPEVIRSEVLKVPGVVYCEIDDSTSGSMFVGYSFIGFSGTVENPEQSDFVSPIFYDNPFFFVVAVKITRNANLAQIIQTVQDNKAAGTRFAVEILETLQ